MKIAIIGYSGSGKSTLAKYIGRKCKIPVLHLDQVHWLPGWQEREREEAKELVATFLKENSSWVIDGNYPALEHGRRMEEADTIIFLKFNRVSCLLRAWKRYCKNRGQVRESMGEGCMEKMDLEFVWWLLHEGRAGKQKRQYQEALGKYGKKTAVVRNQRELELVGKCFSGSGSLAAMPLERMKRRATYCPEEKRRKLWM